MKTTRPTGHTRPTRRSVVAAGFATAALLALSACGSSANDAKASADTATESTAAATTRVVDTVEGKVTVPAEPKRVVAIQPYARGTLYDVGIDPIGVYNEGEQYIAPRYQDKVKAATDIGSSGQVDLEKVAALKPDLIVGVDFSWNTDIYSKLSVIAPTVIAPSTSWQATAEAVADAVGKSAELDALEKQFDERAATIKATYADVLAAKKWDILQGGFDKGKFWIYGPKSDAGAILSAAGVQFASGSTGVTDNGNKAVSYENIDLLGSADVIGYYANYDGTPNNEGPQLFKQAGFKALPAVQAGATVPIPDFLPGGYGDALGVLDSLEDGLKKLQAAS
jgi:iron complex transport system substrate-binding protein